jgi:hypothetical protein|tara:strand:+ start:444 stop:902 length:459 start_codon:yes stop_codon:yes gene_type:complete
MLQLLTGLLPIGEKLVERLIPDPAARAKAMQELKDMEQKGELAKLEAEYADRDSARRRETAIATSENASWLNKTVTPILALGTVSMSFGLFLIIIFVDVDINSGAKDILVYVLGALNSATTMVLAYYFGSSVGSKQKSSEINDLLEKKEPRI